jgi:hypothetical protein
MSTLALATLRNLAGTASTSSDNVINGSAKAWVNFNGTGTVAIRASYNVSSITDNGTGDYTVNFTNALPDANYSAVVSARYNTPVGGTLGNAGFSASSVRVYAITSGASLADTDIICVAIFR